MASLVWRPTSPREVQVVRVGEVQYTFAPGIPQEVPQPHVAAVTTALTATGTVTAGPPEI